jgi:predicted dithiol-disulfide oxidoreductase (DUF899 family)
MSFRGALGLMGVDCVLQEAKNMALPQVVTQNEWERARLELLAQEKELTRLRDRVSASRRRLPMVEVTKPYVFEGPSGSVGLLELFADRRQLIVCHFMFDPSWEDGCPSCSAGADEMSDGHRKHLAARDTTLVYVSRAPLEKLERYKAKRGWTFPWYSSDGSDFNYDFAVTLDPDVTDVVYNFRPMPELSGEYPGRSHFLRVDDRVFHTYSVYARGLETIGGSYYLLDETALGRQEEWEEPRGRVESARAAVPDFGK